MLSLISAAVFALISHVDRRALYCVTEYLSETQSTFFCTLSGMKSPNEGLFKIVGPIYNHTVGPIYNLQSHCRSNLQSHCHWPIA